MSSVWMSDNLSGLSGWNGDLVGHNYALSKRKKKYFYACFSKPTVNSLLYHNICHATSSCLNSMLVLFTVKMSSQAMLATH